MRLFGFILTFLFSGSLWAHITLECGYGLNEENMTLEHREFSLVSENDEFNGSYGETWQMYDSKENLVKGALLIEASNESLILKVKNGQDVLGPIWVIYEFKNPWGHLFLKAKKSSLGEYVGRQSLGVLDCLVFEI